MLIRSPRKRRRSSGGSPTSSRPRKRTLPLTVALTGSRPIVAIANVVFPHPDSPTSPKISPAATDRDTSLTAETVPSSVSNPTSTCSRVKIASLIA